MIHTLLCLEKKEKGKSRISRENESKKIHYKREKFAVGGIL